MKNETRVWISTELRPNKDCFIIVKYDENPKHFIYGRYFKDSNTFIDNDNKTYYLTIGSFIAWTFNFDPNTQKKIPTREDLGYSITAKCCYNCNNSCEKLVDGGRTCEYKCGILKDFVDPGGICDGFTFD